jgi:beta/gamma crystallin
MKRLVLVMTALLFVTIAVFVPPVTAGETLRASGDMPQIIVFDDDNFLGDHAHVFGNMKDLGKWGNSISSIIILSGTWDFFDDEDFQGAKMVTLGPGMYPRVTDKGFKDNSISSIRLASPAARATR